MQLREYNNSEYLLSVIIPVYNAEQYLHECLDHLVKMGERVQIVLADDESTDSSYSICREYADKHNNIILLQEENGGPSKARNLALTAATGKYIVFCDSDDWLDERLLLELEKYEGQDYDFFQFGISGDFGLLYNEVTILDEAQKLDLFSLIVGLRDERNIGHGYFGLVTCKVFKRELVQDIAFDPDVVGEDTLYAVQAFKKINTAVFLPYRFYYYRIIDGSYSRKYFPNIIPMASRMLELMKVELPEAELMKNAFDCHAIDKFWWCMNSSIKDYGDYSEVRNRLKELCDIPVYCSAFSNTSIRPTSFRGKLKFDLIRNGCITPLALLLSLRRR